MEKRTYKFASTDVMKLLLTAVFVSLVFVPVLRMLLFVNVDNISMVLSASTFGLAVRNSFISTMIATVITVVLAYILAMCMERVQIKYKNVFAIIFVLPMLVPSISIGMGLTILFGNNGIITKALNLSEGIYGMWGIVLGGILYALPVAFLMLSDVIRYEDASPYEAANVLGMSKYRQFTAITFPYIRKPLIAVVFSTFTLIITDYGVPLMIGGKYTTIPVIMYQEVIGQLNFGKGAVYGSVLLIPAVIAFIVDLLNRDGGNLSFVAKTYEPSNDKKIKLFAYMACVCCGVFTLLPIVSFVILSFAKDYPNDLSFTFDNFEKAMNLHAGDYFVNSLLIAFMVGLAGTVIAFFTAYLSVRVKSKISRFLHLASMTSAAIPGIVLGLSYVLSFKGFPFYGTIVMLIMVNLVHFISSPYLMMYNSLSKMNENIEAVAQTLGIRRIYTIRDVFIPICKNTLLEMFAYFFVNCMITISAVSFLANTSNKPVALMINQFEAQMQLECAAVVSLMILTANLGIKGLFYFLKNKRG